MIFFRYNNSKIYGKETRVTKPHYSEYLFPVPWPFVKSRFHCTTNTLSCLQDISTGSTIFTVTAADEDMPDPPGKDLLTYTIEEGNVVSAISTVLPDMQRELQ